jgi:hypothetical protein
VPEGRHGCDARQLGGGWPGPRPGLASAVCRGSRLTRGSCVATSADPGCWGASPPAPGGSHAWNARSMVVSRAAMGRRKNTAPTGPVLPPVAAITTADMPGRNRSALPFGRPSSNLLIRRCPFRCPGSFGAVRDLGLVYAGYPRGSGASLSCSSVWLPAWPQRVNVCAPAIAWGQRP